MLGERIKSLRLSKQISQVELSHKLSVSKQSVSNWENNNIMPSIDILIRLADYFHCSTDYLLELDTKKFSIETRNLTEVQFAYVSAIIEEFEKLNSKLSSSEQRQQDH